MTQPNPLPVSVGEDHGAAQVQSDGPRQDGDEEVTIMVREAANRVTGGNCAFVDDDLLILEMLAFNAVAGGLMAHVHASVAEKAVRACAHHPFNAAFKGPTPWSKLLAQAQGDTPPSSPEQTASEGSGDTDKPLTITHEMDESGEVREIKG